FLVYSTTEVYDVPGSLYPEILPDRASGFCLDLAFLNDDGSISPITEQNNGWLAENAWRFGFVFSYTESNRDQTGVTSAPYHLRYVGKEHAAVMYYNNKMDLHTYLSTLRSYPAGNGYQYCSDSMNLKISYIPASGTGTTVISVPEDGKHYSISGNNTDGFILCVSDAE
ncbi:MAG: D-alanyl-D-alanine carboxypeptidase family protein, partial [Oscillospiraceae bacterium]|nr:D-alanyl-D-alanine carboxypeptidase family protein [Oscillospiraceae bacterium]